MKLHSSKFIQVTDLHQLIFRNNELKVTWNHCNLYDKINECYVIKVTLCKSKCTMLRCDMVCIYVEG